MKTEPLEILNQGRAILDPVLQRHGFVFEGATVGQGSGGRYACGTYVNGNRRLEFAYRYSLGLVTYRFGQTSVDHESYMRGLLGTKGGNKYPGFSDEPMDGFKGLAYDFENFATAFSSGNCEEFERCVITAKEWKRTPWFARLP